MTSQHAWLRHPATTIGPPPACPVDAPHFATRPLAADALTHGRAAHRLTVTRCGCGRWIHVVGPP